MVQSLLYYSTILTFSFTLINGDNICGIVPPYCEPITKTCRTYDGTCNNLNNPSWGSAYSEYSRILDANYGDGIKTIRKAANGSDLPNARFVRRTCLTDDQLLKDAHITRIFIGILQLLTHDISGNYLYVYPPSYGGCCTPDMTNPPSVPPYCQNIKIPLNDPYYSQYNITCMPMVKTLTNFDLGCNSKYPQAQQISEPTPVIDFSNLYGLSDEINANLREGVGGLLKSQVISGCPFLPLDTTQDSCLIPPGADEVCFLAGDPKVNQNPDITSFHTIMLREHNRMATKLAHLNPCWDDEKVFQVARSIVIAVWQYIIYYEVLPWVLGDANMYANQLTYVTPFHVNDYDCECQASIYNEFSVAFRGLHTFLVGKLGLYNEERDVINTILLKDVVFRPDFMTKYDNFKSFVLGMVTENPYPIRPHFDNQITNYLFKMRAKLGIDLAATDIQRSRSHGIPSYNDMRAYCQLNRASTFEDFSDAISDEHIQLLKKAYNHVDDVDLYVGGNLEKKELGAQFGKTFQCIFLSQFKKLRKCDRFWFENESQFTFLQLQEIRKMSIATLICANTKIKKMQLHALFSPGGLLNTPIDCSLIPDIDLYAWYDFCS